MQNKIRTQKMDWSLKAFWKSVQYFQEESWKNSCISSSKWWVIQMKKRSPNRQHWTLPNSSKAHFNPKKTADQEVNKPKQTHFISKKNLNSAILGVSLNSLSLVKEMEKLLFEEKNKKYRENEFITKAISSPCVLYCLAILERFFHPVIMQLEEQIETNLNTLSLSYLLKLGILFKFFFFFLNIPKTKQKN